MSVPRLLVRLFVCLFGGCLLASSITGLFVCLLARLVCSFGCWFVRLIVCLFVCFPRSLQELEIPRHIAGTQQPHLGYRCLRNKRRSGYKRLKDNILPHTPYFNVAVFDAAPRRAKKKTLVAKPPLDVKPNIEIGGAGCRQRLLQGSMEASFISQTPDSS